MSSSWKALVASVSGFVISLSLVLLFVKKDDPTPMKETASQSRERSEHHSQSIDFSQLKIPFSSMTPAELLAFASLTKNLSAEEREDLLERLLELSEEDRQASLAITLLRWVESDPEAAVLWCMENLEHAERQTMLKELATTWAHHDAMELAKWWAENMPKGQLYGSSSVEPTTILIREDPFACATYMGMPALNSYHVYGMVTDDHLPEPAEFPSYAEALVGKPGYHPSHLDYLNGETDVMHFAPSVSVWNELFEKVAVAWHRDSPEACEKWLSQFSADSQAVVKFRIKNGFGR